MGVLELTEDGVVFPELEPVTPTVESIIRFRAAMQDAPYRAIERWECSPHVTRLLNSPTAYRLWQMKRTVKLRAVQRWNKKRRRR